MSEEHVYMTHREVAKLLRTQPVKARGLLERDDVPLILLGPRSWRVKTQHFEEWERAQTASARRQAGHVVAQRVRLRAFRDSDLPDFLRPSSN